MLRLSFLYALILDLLWLLFIASNVNVFSQQMDSLPPYESWIQSKFNRRQIRDCQHVKYGNVTHSTTAAQLDNLMNYPLVETKVFAMKLDDIQQRTVRGHYSIVHYPTRTLSVLEPGKYGGCTDHTRETVSKSSEQYTSQCLVAMNAGFFNTTSGACIGNLISDGRLIQTSGGIQNVHFGIKNDGTLFIGYLPSDDVTVGKDGFQQLVGGVIWLLRNGEIFIESSKKIECPDSQETGIFDTFVNVRSARTSIGFTSEGRVIILHIDGKTYQDGVNLYEMAGIMKKLGATNAINTDGGGSATFVINGTVVSYPSDECPGESFLKCVRPVSSIICVHEPLCDPPNCNNHGICKFGECICDKPWLGPICNEVPCQRHNCSSRGTCTADGCICNWGWTGDRCQKECKAGFWGPQCSLPCKCKNGGKCVLNEGTCICRAGFKGAICEEICSFGWYGNGCSNRCNCPNQCGCHHITGSCSTKMNLSEVNDVGMCIAEKLIQEQHLVKENPGQYRLWTAIVLTTSVIAAFSIVVAMSLICCKCSCTCRTYPVSRVPKVSSIVSVDDSSEGSVSEAENTLMLYRRK